MMTYKKQNNISPVFIWVLVMVYFIILALITSCNTPKKIARNNEKAVQTVLTDSTLFKLVGGKYTALQPKCTNDTIIGETEVLILSDTQYVSKSDTLFKDVIQKITNTVYKDRVKYITDNKAINELQDSLHDRAVRMAQLQGRIDQLTEDRDQQRKRAEVAEAKQKQLGWGIWAVVALLLITHGLRSIPSIRKAIGI